MGEDIIQTGVVLTFAVEGEETIVASAVAQDGLTASVENYAASATSAYAKANAAQKSIIDAYMQQAAAAKASGMDTAKLSSSIRQSISDLEKYAVSWAQGANASITGSAAAAEAAGILRVQLDNLAAAQLKQAAAARAAAAEQAAAAKLATNDAAIQGYLAEADKIAIANTARSLQLAQLQEIAAQISKDIAAFVSLGDAGVTAADASAQALDVVEAALASIAVEQKVVIAGMAGIAKAASGAAMTASMPIAPAEVRLMKANDVVMANEALGVQQIELQKVAAALKSDVAAFMAMGEEGVLAASESSEALKLVQAALASIAAEQRTVIGGMAGIAESSVAAGSAAGPALAKAAAGIAGINTGLVAMAVNMAPLAAGVGLAMLTKHSVESMAELEKLHQRMGISTEDLSVMSMAAKQVGIEMHDVAIGMRMFDRHVDEAVEGRGKLVIANFKAIGLSMDDLKHKDPMTLFLMFATAISKIEDPTVRSAKATELMGRASERLIPFMNMLAGEGFGKLAAEASRLGVVVSGSAASAALEYEKNWARVKLQLVGVGNAIATSLLPLLNALSEPPKSNGLLTFLTDLTFWLKAIVTSTYAAYEVMQKLSGIRIIKAAVTESPGEFWGKARPDKLFDTIAQPSDTFAKFYSDMWGDQKPSPVVPKGDIYDRGTEQEQVDKATERLAIARDQLDISTKQAAIAGAETGNQARQLEYQLKLLQIQKQIDTTDRSIDSMKGVDAATKAHLKALEILRAHQDIVAASKEYDRNVATAATTQNNAVATLREQIEVQRLRVGLAVSDNIVQSQALDYAIKRKEIANELAQQERAIAAQVVQKTIEPEIGAAEIAEHRQMAQLKLNAAAETYRVTVAATVRAENEALMLLSNRLAVQQLQTESAGGTSAMMKEQLSYAEKQLQIENDLAAATRRITAPGPNALPKAEQEKQLGIERAIAGAKWLAVTLDTLSATQRIAIAEAAITRELNLEAEAQQRGVAVAQNELELARLSRQEFATVNDIQTAKALQRASIEIQLADQIASIREDRRKKIMEQDVVIAEAQARASLIGAQIDMVAVDAAFEHKRQINAATNAAILAANTQAAGKELGVEIDTIQKSNAARSEARYSDAIMEVQQFANTARLIAQAFGDPMTLAFSAALDSLVDGMKKAADRSNEIWRTVGDNISQGFSTLFQTLSRGGGLSAAFKDMGQQFESSFGNIIEKRIKEWSDELTLMAQNQPLRDANGDVQKDANGNVMRSFSPDQQNKARFEVGGLMAAQAGFAGYSAGSGHGQATASAVAAATSAAIAFASSGPYAILAAVIAAAASEIGSALSTAQKQSEYLYGVPVFTNGRASIGAEQKINAQKSQELTAQLQDSFNAAWNGFVTVMGKLGANVPQLPDRLLGGFQPAPSANWEKHFQQYLTDTLPLTIAGMFKDGMQKSFVASGLTSEAFDKFWAEAAALDPTKRMQFWQDLADGIVSFAHAQKVFDAVKNLGGDYTGAKFDANGNSIYGMDNDFMASLRVGAKQVFDIARDMVSLVGPERIAAFKQMGASVDQITTSFTQFIQQVGASLKAVKQNFTDAYLQHNLAAAGEVRDINGNIVHQNDPNAQARLLEAAFDQNQYQIDHASQLGLNPQDIERLTQQSIGYLNAIFALNPTAEADAWWRKQMSALQTSSEAAIKLIGDAAVDEMGKFLLSIDPFKKYMVGLPVEIDPSILALELQFDGLAAAIAALTVSIKNSTTENDGNKNGGGTDDSGGGKDPKTGDPHYIDPGGVGPNSIGGATINIYLNGTFVDTISFQEAIYNGVSLAIREDPSKYAPIF